MAFVTQEDIIALIEGLVSHIFTTALPLHPQPFIPFPRLTHSEALEKVKILNAYSCNKSIKLFVCAVQF